MNVAARPLLVLPHLFALCLLAPVAMVAAVAGWAAALVLGRLPDPVSDFLTGYLRWQTRVAGYLLLLTDAYPPFTLADTPYPVRLTARPGPLNRGAVALRLVLVLPAAVVAAVTTYGIALVLVVAWLVTMVSGRLPSSLHQVFAAAVRYQARATGYLTMVTAEYPWGLLGDPAPAAPLRSASWQPAPPSPDRDPYWQVQLSAAAKNLSVAVVVLGVTSVAILNITNAVTRYDRIQTEQAAAAHVQGAYQSLSVAVIRYQAQTRSCESAARALPCLTDAAHRVSGAFTVFTRSLSDVSMPSAAVAARRLLVSDGTRAVRDFRQLSASTTAGRYELVVDGSDLSKLLIRFDLDYEQLGTQLTNAD
jgi:hypothetical protein